MADLLEITRQLRMRARTIVDPADLVEAYFHLRASAPQRSGRGWRYLSETRRGITSGGTASNRREEHLAAALFGRREIFFATGERLRLLDYQFPLKAGREDKIGKIDLLGIFDEDQLAVIELKTGNNSEDRRMALVEALSYSAVIEANIEQIRGASHRRTRVLEIDRRG